MLLRALREMEMIIIKQKENRVAEMRRKIPPGEVRKKFLFFLEGAEEEEGTDLEFEGSEPPSSSSFPSTSFSFSGIVSVRSVEVKKLPLAGEEEETPSKALLISSVFSYCSCKPETVLVVEVTVEVVVVVGSGLGWWSISSLPYVCQG